MLCSEAIAVNRNDRAGHASVLRCKRWSCELCRPFNHRRIKRAAREGQPTVLLTLTCNPALYDTPDQAAQVMKRSWVNLRKALAREKDIPKLPFIAIFESTKQGWPHLHILMRCKWIDQRWLSDTWNRLTGAKIVDIRKIDEVGRVSAYVAKYISKAPEAFAHCKRWWRSHDYQVVKEEGEPFFRFSSEYEKHPMTIAQWLASPHCSVALVVEQRPGYVRWEEPAHPRERLRQCPT